MASIPEYRTWLLSDHEGTGQTQQLYALSSDIIPKKNVSCIANILDISTKPMPLCSPYSPPSYKINSIFLAPLSTELSYLVVLFILQLVHTASFS